MPDSTPTTDQLFDRIEQICDAHKAQFSLQRAARCWIAHIRLEDGRTWQRQDPLDQHRLLSAAVAELEAYEQEQAAALPLRDSHIKHEVPA